MANDSQQLSRNAILAAACLALNLGLGKVSNLLGLPIVFDTVGSILAPALVGPWYALLVGILSSFIGGVFIHPAFPYYVGTQLVIVLLAVAAMRLGLFSRLMTAIGTGVGIGVASAIVSAPVTALVFGGVTIPSVTALNVLFLASGKSLWQSVLTGSIIVESIDKVMASSLVWLILSRLPKLR